MYKRALVPLDGSSVAEAIIPFILDIAGPLDMEVVLLRVVEPIPPVVAEGARNPADEIVAAARETGADLIAMSTHGRSGLGRLVFGSVAQAVLRHVEIPVFLMRTTEAQVAKRVARAPIEKQTGKRP